MANTRKTIPVVFGRLRNVKTPRRTQGDYGQVLVISDAIKLPADFVVHFCNEGDAVTKTQIGHDNMVTVPPQFLKDGRDIICYIFIHDGDTDGRTMYTIRIPIVRRPDTEEIEPTPEQEDVIMQAISTLNNAVALTNEDAEIANAAAASAAHYANIAQQTVEEAGHLRFYIEDGKLYLDRTGGNDE